MTSFDRFRTKNLNKIVSKKKANTKFIFNGIPSTTISFESRDDLEVCLVNQQEKNLAYVYSELDNALDEGTIFSCKGLYFLIVEHIMIVEDVDFNKYKAYLCNVELDDWKWGYFKGPEKSYINVVTQEDLAAISKQKPILIAQKSLFKIGDIVYADDRPWLIIESDTISDKNIGYYSLEATTDTKVQTNTTTIPSETYPIELNVVNALDDISLVTEDGYFYCSKKLLELKISSDLITFKIPFGISSLIVNTKENGIIIENEFKVV